MNVTQGENDVVPYFHVTINIKRRKKCSASIKGHSEILSSKRIENQIVVINVVAEEVVAIAESR